MQVKTASTLVLATALVALSGPAFSADWSGFHAGVHTGYALGHTGFDYQGGGAASHDTEGPFGGFQAGYDMQSGSLVYGAELEASVYSVDGSTHCPNPSWSCQSSLGPGGSARVRVGYATGNFLLYGTGGGALVDARLQTVNPAGQDFGENQTQLGWTAGLGVEYRWTPLISTKLEYRYTDLGDATYTVDTGYKIDADLHYHAVILGVNWHF